VSKSTQGGQMATAIAARLEKAKAEAAPYLVAANDGAFSTGTVRLGAMTEGWP
jgi:hypothetical protein